MINKLNELKANSKSPEVQKLCESAINTLTSAIYNGVSDEAQHEIERITMSNLFKTLDVEKDDYTKNWLRDQKRVFETKNIGVRESIKSLMESEAKNNPTLYEVLEGFGRKLADVPEVLLYEEFVSSMSNFTWVPAVEKNIAKILETVKANKSNIYISKIIEEMRLSRSNYLIPLIEDVVNDYLNDRNDNNRHILKESLVKFSYDPFVRSILNCITDDAVELQLEYASANADLDSVYSPILYLGENEALFNVKGTYYVKKGNNVNRIKNSDTRNISESFRSLCNVVNDPTVEISKGKISVYSNTNTAVITEGKISLNGKDLDGSSLNEAKALGKLSGESEFFDKIDVLSKNFDDIAEVDFVKRVYLKENYQYAADVFKLRDNISITTYDPINNKVTFFRNVNPIQAGKIMMEHMRFDVSSAFKDILPNKEKILNQIDETEKAYIKYIDTLNEKLGSLKADQGNAIVKMTVDAINEELNSVKNEYKDYVNSVQQYTNVSEGISLTLDVDGTKYNVPIPQLTSDQGQTSTSTEGAAGTEVKSDNELEPASQITFDSDESELLGPNSTHDSDNINLGVDDVEARADAEELAKSAEEDNKDNASQEEESDDELNGADLEDLGDEDDTDKEKGEGKEDKKPVKKENEAAGGDKHLNDSLTKTPADNKVNGADINTATKKKFFLKKKKGMNESIHIDLKKKLVESVNVGDSVSYDGKKGYITGQMGDGKYIVQIQGSTLYVEQDDSKLKSWEKKPNTMDVPWKFDKTTLKALREQYVKCGIFVNSTPVKTNDCFVNYAEWEEAKNDGTVSVLVEGRTSIMSKSNVKILEDINTFANPDNYVKGVIIDEQSGDVIENVLINAIDYSQALGDSNPVKIMRSIDGTYMVDTMPVARLKTLSV